MVGLMATATRGSHDATGPLVGTPSVQPHLVACFRRCSIEPQHRATSNEGRARCVSVPTSMTVVVEQRSDTSSVTLSEPFSGSSNFVLRLPQYLTRAMFTGARAVTDSPGAAVM